MKSKKLESLEKVIKIVKPADQSDTVPVCDCGAVATTEISLGWDRRANCGRYAQVCDACYNASLV